MKEMISLLKERGFYKGINFGGWFSQCAYDETHFDNFITESDFAKVSSWGLDHIRLPIDYNIIECSDGTINENVMFRIDRVLELCRKYSLNTVLDLHKTAGFSFDTYSENEYGFFENANYQEHFYKIWEHIAKRYGSFSDRIAFELLNEVTDKEYLTAWNSIVKKCIERIRVFAPDVIILVGSYWNNDAEAVKDLDAPYDSNVIYNMHCYEPLKFTHQGAYWTDKIDPDSRYSFDEIGITDELFEKLFSSAIKKAKENNTELYCGEYGLIDCISPEDSLKWYRTIHNVFEKYGIGRCAWSYKKMDFGISDTRLDTVRRELQQYF